MPPWEKYAQPAAAPQGDPVIARDPYKVSAEARAAEDQRLQQAAAARAEEDQRMQRAKFEDDKRQREADRAAGVNAEARESENKAASFLIRALGANKGYEATGIGPRSLVGQKVADYAPNVLNSLPGMVGNSDARQVADSTQDEFIAASLRQDSGAAIPPEEMDRQRRIYFPMPGDSETVIEQKRQARLRAIEGLKMSAGRLEGEAEKRFNELSGAQPQSATDGQSRVELDDQGNPVAIDIVDEAPARPATPPGGVDGNSPGYAQIAAGIGDAVEGLTRNTVGMVIDPINTTIYRGLGYDKFTSDIGQTLRDALGLPEGDQRIAAVNQAAAGGLGLGSLARAGSNFVGGTARNALAQFGANPGMDFLTGASAGAGGELAKAAGAGPLGQTLAMVAGGVTPNALMGARSAIGSIGRSPPGGPPPNMGVVAAGERQSVPIRQADARPELRGEMANLETTARGGQIIQQGRAADVARMEQRVSEVGGGGNPSDPFTVGSRVQGAVKRHGERTGKQGNVLYKRAEHAAGNVRVDPVGASQAIDGQIAELTANGANANRDLIRYLEDVKADLASPGGLGIDAIRSQRTAMRGQIKTRNLDATDAERRVGIVLDAASQDIETALKGNAKALGAYKTADAFWKERSEFRRQISQQLVGNKDNPVPAERAAERLIAMTRGKGDAERFARMWGEMEPDEQADIAATVAQSLGRKANGDFSPATLIKSLDPRSGVNPRTARLIFGKDGAEALSDLRMIAQAKTDTASAMNNSRTGNMVNRAAGGLKSLVLGGLGFSTGGVGGAVALPMAGQLLRNWGEERAARALMNPDFTKWLRNAPQTTDPKVINSYFKRLETAAAKSPIFAGDVKAFQSALTDVFRNSPGRAAAEDEPKAGRIPPQQ